jgi:hypothetical protein
MFSGALVPVNVGVYFYGKSLRKKKKKKKKKILLFLIH